MVTPGLPTSTSSVAGTPARAGAAILADATAKAAHARSAVIDRFIVFSLDGVSTLADGLPPAKWVPCPGSSKKTPGRPKYYVHLAVFEGVLCTGHRIATCLRAAYLVMHRQTAASLAGVGITAAHFG